MWADKEALLAGAADVEALSYSRASADKKKQGTSCRVQDRLNRQEIDKRSWSAGPAFSDNDRSGSRYARQEREDYERLLEVIESGRGDVLVMWELARGQRDLEVYVQIRGLCERVGLFFWLVGGTLYDLRVRADRLTLNILATLAEDQAENIRDNVQRGIDGAAFEGKPHGKLTYGYRRLYHPRTRAFLSQDADTEPRTAVAEDGTETEYSPAGVVANEIFVRIDEGIPLITIERDLNARGIPSPEGKKWRRGIIRKIAMNPAYVGKRVLRGEVVGDAVWSPLVDEELFWSVQNILSKPERKTTRSSRAVWLLSYLAGCGVCRGPLHVHKVKKRTKDKTKAKGAPVYQYQCYERRCVGVTVEQLDSYVESLVVAWLSRTDVRRKLLAVTRADDRQAANARAELARLEKDLQDWRDAAEAGTVTPIMAGKAESGLLKQIAAVRKRAEDASIPPVLRGMLGPDAADRWERAPLAVKRDIIRAVATIHLHPAGVGTGKLVPLADRLEIGGLLGGQPLAS